MIRAILFDLDGTLTDPAEGITNSVAYALKHYGINIEDKTNLNTFVGPPLSDSFQKYFGFDKKTSLEAVEIYREYFKDKGIFENIVYDGIPEMLEALKESGKTLILATAKPEIFAKRILEHFSLTKYFSFVCGSLLNHSRLDKHEIIEHILSECKIDRAEAAMVGDRYNDMEGGKKSRLVTVGAAYGYGSREELYENGADYIVNTVSELKALLLSL